ncbi:hypothetical protein [Devosia nitrariae]|uniref:TnsA endonuclease N-terminal domain-containing protein n=1 Tax=Devosia nitrariae TaxID=2071872 RepID=A0ABQ5W9P7_9HYPH|nr:hypothetical protein [Devosia nitrariae]GLQ56554.1 hypothetical protein GCM10010862_38130 [Devosia nitrariae]
MLLAMKNRSRPWKHWSSQPTPPAVDGRIIRVPTLKVGGRKIARHNRGSNTGYILDPIEFVLRECESDKEYLAVLLAFSEKEVASVVCQAPIFRYFDQDGAERSTYFDLVITFTDGRKIVVMVKTAERVWKKDISRQAAQMSTQLNGFADSIRLVTEADMPFWLVHNARLFHSVRQDSDTHLDQLVLARAQGLNRDVSIEDLVAPFQGGFRSTARLLFDGKLASVVPEAIFPETMVKATSV